MSVEIEGLDKVAARLDEAVKLMAGPVREEIEMSVAEDAAEEARRRAPVLSGRLRDSIEARRGEAGSAVVRAKASYAVYVEFGTHDTPKQPFFFPAIHRVRAELPRRAAETYRRRVPGLS